jgi:hypothetical protein
MVKRFALAASLTLALAACQQNDNFDRSARHMTPVPAATLSLMAQRACRRTTRS